MEYFPPDVGVILLIILSHLCLPFAVARVCPHSRSVRSGGVGHVGVRHERRIATAFPTEGID